MGSKRKSKKLLNESESTSKYRKGENIASKDFCLRFPEIAESIFDNLGNENLVNCKEVCRAWSTFLRSPKFLLMRKIEKTIKYRQEFGSLWKNIAKNVDTQTIFELDAIVTKFYADDENFESVHDSEFHSPLHLVANTGNTKVLDTLMEKAKDILPKNKDGNGWTPFHYAAIKGHLETCELILGKIEGKHPTDNDGWTPLHYAAEEGHLKVCQRILEFITDKNPKDINGWTPLHTAALKGHLNIFKAIQESLPNNGYSRNPSNKDGSTPLHIAAFTGRFEICHEIKKYVTDMNPKDKKGWTPLHEAAHEDHLKVCQLILENMKGDKNPGDDAGCTPLHLAAQEGHIRIVAAFYEEIDDKNPADHDGWTPLHGAAKACHGNICKLITDNVQDTNPADHQGRTPKEIWISATRKLRNIF
jgi:ankyrin repeat protein